MRRMLIVGVILLVVIAVHTAFVASCTDRIRSSA